MTAAGRPLIPLVVTPNIELNPWRDLENLVDRSLSPAEWTRIGLLPAGMVSGKAAVELVLQLPDGRVIVAETSLVLFRMAAAALLASPVAEMEDL